MIFYNLLSENGGIWDSGHENVALRKNKDSESKEEIYIGQETIWKETRYYDPKSQSQSFKELARGTED